MQSISSGYLLPDNAIFPGELWRSSQEPADGEMLSVCAKSSHSTRRRRRRFSQNHTMFDWVKVSLNVVCFRLGRPRVFSWVLLPELLKAQFRKCIWISSFEKHSFCKRWPSSKPVGTLPHYKEHPRWRCCFALTQHQLRLAVSNLKFRIKWACFINDVEDVCHAVWRLHRCSRIKKGLVHNISYH